VREFVTDALKPAQIRSIQIDEEAHRISITVDEEELSKAIGRRGQNARLTSKLVDWDVQIDKDESAHEAFEARVSEAAHVLMEQIEISEDMANVLVTSGMVNLETIATEADPEEIADILEISQEEAAALHQRAKDKFEAEPSTA
jgi:N utilization substance protein A